ncbi:nucleotide-binding protein [Roseibium alexandrii]|uniref:Septum formation inhibitor-activating ATPase n=1 Tax=Roseibium alexandrii TaxID=388408 RepID=A0A0M7ANX3_9HYPH|nr:Septum formation inhibitor-activating ATPase [Roseibium alexandrii]
MQKLIICLLGLKGGSGKSTTARMLATAYAEAGLSVKIADFDVWQQTACERRYRSLRDNDGCEQPL